MKAIGFNQGQIGDLVMNLITCKAFKTKYPDSHLVFGINKKYESCAPIFYNHPLIDDVKIWENYHHWPSQSDQEYINNNNFDIVFNAMPSHKNELWYLYEHHTQALCKMHDLEPPQDLQIELTSWFDIDKQYENYVAFTTYSSGGAVRDVPIEVSNKIIEYLHSIGLNTIQLGLPSHEKLNTTTPAPGGSIFDDVKIAKSCKFVVTADTGMNWIMSGYKAKVLGLYASNSYPLNAPLKNRAPVNPNAIYLQADNIINISFDKIKEAITNLLN
jgi:ADP-heptose:LPS heptosyltransferase